MESESIALSRQWIKRKGKNQDRPQGQLQCEYTAMIPFRQGEGKESKLHLWIGSLDWKMSMSKVREHSKEVEGAKGGQAECQELVDTEMRDGQLEVLA